MQPTTVLSIAGSDSGGGAGIQADIRTLSAFGVHATTAVTAVTAQNTRAVTAIQALSPELVQAQLDAVFDEGLIHWFDEALALGFRPLELEAESFARLAPLGWRRVVMPAGCYPHLEADHVCIDYSGWPLYCNADLPDQMVYDVCTALAAREAEIPWEEDTYTGVDQLGRETEATPMDVPMHPGAARWFRETR